MKQYATLLLAVAVTAGSIMLSGTAPAQANGSRFSDASLHGSYACLESGVGPGPTGGAVGGGQIGQVAVFRYDGRGHVNAYTIYLNVFRGVPCHFVGDGTYAINPDGTGSSDVVVNPSPGDPDSCPTDIEVIHRLVLGADGQSYEANAIGGIPIAGPCQQQFRD